MKRFCLCLLLLAGCTSKPVKQPELPSTVIGSTLSAKQGAQMDTLAGYFTAIKTVADTLPQTKAKDGIEELVLDGEQITGLPVLATQTKFEQLAKDLLADDKTKGENERRVLASENGQLTQEIAKLKSDHEAALTQEKADAVAAIAQARLEGEQKLQKIEELAGYGLSFLLVILGAVSFPLATYIPQLGPRVAFGLIWAGLLGMVTTLIFTHYPQYVAYGVGAVMILLTFVATGIYFNHEHHTAALKSNGTAVQS